MMRWTQTRCLKMRAKRARQIRKSVPLGEEVYKEVTHQMKDGVKTTLSHTGPRQLYQDAKKSWTQKKQS